MVKSNFERADRATVVRTTTTYATSLVGLLTAFKDLLFNWLSDVFTAKNHRQNDHNIVWNRANSASWLMSCQLSQDNIILLTLCWYCYWKRAKCPYASVVTRAAASTRVLASTRLQKLLRVFFTTRVLVKFYFPLQSCTSGFNFCKLNYWFVAIWENLDSAICTLISFNFQLHCSIFVLRVAYTGTILPKY